MQMHGIKSALQSRFNAVISCSKFKVSLTLCQHNKNAQCGFCSKSCTFAQDLHMSWGGFCLV